MKVYTKTGDAGMTSLVGGKRVPKTHARLEAYGTADELNSHLGLLLTYLTEERDKQMVTGIQNTLFVVCSELATDVDCKKQPQSTVTEELITQMERAIDEINATLPPWRGFILPGGERGAAVGHVCRCVCRRLERRIHALAQEAPVSPLVMSYVNRLSDYLFVLARKINLLAGTEENIWVKS